jgi:DNA-binding XRE family transcriptional regulator
MVRKYLTAARRERRMTQAELASAVGVTRNTIIKLESGLAVDEGIEGRIEKVFGWGIGSLDALRKGSKAPAVDGGLPAAPAAVTLDAVLERLAAVEQRLAELTDAVGALKP